MPLHNINSSYTSSSSSSSWMTSSSSWKNNDWGVVLFSWLMKAKRSLSSPSTTAMITTTQCEAIVDARPSSSSSSYLDSFLDWMSGSIGGNSRTTSSATGGGGGSEGGSGSSRSTMTGTTDKKSNTSSSSSQDAATTIADVLLTLGFWIALGVLTQLAVRTLVGHSLTASSADAEARDRPAASLVLRRIEQILAKRHAASCSQQQIDDDETDSSSGGDPKRKKAAAAAAAAAIVVPPLDSYELQMAEVILDPDEIESSFADIGGLDNAKREIYELAVLPLVQPDLFPTNSKLIRPVKGILLYGRPGTGKTMLAKALAKESAAVFIPLQLSKILNKWVGESNKLIAATFSLAHKLEPAIIFIDELDTFLKANNSEASAYLDNIKSEFLTCWDGVATKSTSRVLVLGATNKPQSIDPAILRRMPRTFAVPLPDAAGRLAILELLLADENLSDDAREYLPILARTETVGYSGSDLEELAKAAAMVVVQERTSEFSQQQVMGKRQQQEDQKADDQSALREKAKQPPRPISRQDLEIGLTKVQRTGAAAKLYGREVELEDEEEENATRRTTGNSTPTGTAPLHIDMNIMHTLAAFVRAISEFSHHAPPPNQQSRQNPEDDDSDDIPGVQ